LLIAVIVGLAYDKRVATVFVVSAIAVFALLRAVAAILMALARRLPRARITMLRLAISNIYRPGALTPSVVMSLGLGLAVLVTITQIDGNLRRQFMAALPEHAPSFYFIDIPSTEADRFTAFLRQTRRDRRWRKCRCCVGGSSRPAASRPRTSSPPPTANGYCKATVA
jgi:putative ABC transport system permease protein